MTQSVVVVGILDLPLWLVQVWRLLIWAVELSLLGTFLVFAPEAWEARRQGRPVVSEWTLWLYIGVGVTLARSAYVQIARWDEPVLWYELPVTTVIIACWARARWVRIKKLI